MTGTDSNTTVPALEPLLSIDQASALLNISQSGVYRLLRGGELACVKVGGRTLIEPEAVRDFIAARRRAAATIPPQPAQRTGEAA